MEDRARLFANTKASIVGWYRLDDAHYNIEIVNIKGLSFRLDIFQWYGKVIRATVREDVTEIII